MWWSNRCRKDADTGGANGLESPYHGYLELDVHVEGVTVQKYGVFVLKDTAATVQQRRRSPGVLGTNVLARISNWAELLKMKGRAGASTQDQRLKKQGLVRVAGTRNVWIPPHSAMNTDVTGSACGANAVVEPLSTPLKGDSESQLHWQMHPSHVSLSNWSIPLVKGSGWCPECTII